MKPSSHPRQRKTIPSLAKKRWPRIAVFLAIACVALPARSQQLSSLRNHDIDSPIEIDAGRIEVRDRERQALFLGAVRVDQGNMRLNAEVIRVFYEPGAGNSLRITRLDAEGGVRLASPSETAQARFGVYDVNERLLTLVGDVLLTRGGDRIRGQRLQINLESGVTTLDGATPGRSGSRVTGRFAVPERSNTPGTPQ